MEAYDTIELTTRDLALLLTLVADGILRPDEILAQTPDQTLQDLFTMRTDPTIVKLLASNGISV